MGGRMNQTLHEARDASIRPTDRCGGAPTARMVWFCLPRSLNLEDFLDAHLDDARYFIDLILRKGTRRKRHKYISLQAKFLRRIMHNRTYKTIIDALLKGGVIERRPYIVRRMSFGYRLTARYATDRHVRVLATDRRLLRQLAKWHAEDEANRQARMKPVHHALARHQERLSIDRDEADRILDLLPPASNHFDCQGIQIRDIENREFRLSVGRYGRVSNSITNLKREIRGALCVDGKKLVGVDISCAQPSFLAKLATEAARSTKNGEAKPTSENRGEISTTETGTARRRNETEATELVERTKEKEKGIYDAQIPDDLREFSLLTQNGKLYESLGQHLLERGLAMPREKLKRKFLCDVLAKRWANERGSEYPSVVEDIFGCRFPSVYRFVREFNAHGMHHARLIRELQRQESSFVIETVAADLVVSHPDLFIITVHDAVFTVPEGVSVVQQAFERAFAKIDFRMTLKVSACGEG
jgi:hypothetical protein